MKKIYLCFISILIVPLFILFFGMNVHAADPQTLEELKLWYASYGYTNIDSAIQNLYDYNTNISKKVYAIIRENDNDTGSQKVIFMTFNALDNGELVASPENGNMWIYQYQEGASKVFSYRLVYGTYNLDTKTFNQISSGQSTAGFGIVSDFTFPNPIVYRSDYEPPIDFSWSNVKYDISVPTPSISVDLTSARNGFSSGVWAGQLGPEIPYFLGIKGSEAYANYYMYMDLTIWTPTSGKLKASNGIYEFEPETLVKLPEFVYYDWADFTAAPTSNWFRNINPNYHNSTDWKHDIINKWYNYRGAIENGLEAYGQTFSQMEFNTNLTGTAKTEGIQQTYELLRNAALSGNRVRIRVCFYYIDEELRIRCGNFATWTSSQPSTTSTQQYSDFVAMEGEQANGATQNISVSMAEQQNENTSNIPPINISTGSSNVNVTVNNGDQAVPNNQNYPTVVSYNHDNIFTQFIGTYTNASQYLGGFAAFCNGVLLWIPAEIWAIIGMGFAMALVIMMIKII